MQKQLVPSPFPRYPLTTNIFLCSNYLFSRTTYKTFTTAMKQNWHIKVPGAVGVPKEEVPKPDACDCWPLAKPLPKP